MAVCVYEVKVYIEEREIILKSRGEKETDNKEGNILVGVVHGNTFDLSVYGTNVKQYNKLIDALEKIEKSYKESNQESNDSDNGSNVSDNVSNYSGKKIDFD